MNFEEFSKQAKEKLDTHSSGIDAEDLWESIAPVLEEDKRKRRFLMLPLFAAGFGFLAFFALWYWGDNNQSMHNTAANLSEQTPIESYQEFNQQQPEKEITRVPLSNHQANDEAIKSGPVVAKSDGGLVAVSQRTADKNEMDKNDSRALVETTIPLRLDNKAPKPDAQNLDQEEKEFNRKVNLVQEIAPKPILIIPTKITPLVIKYRGLEKQKTHRFRKGIGISGGIGLNARGLSTNPAFGDYLVRRQDTESTLEDLYLGVDFMIAPTPNWGFRTGLHATRVGSKFLQESAIMEVIPVENSLQATYISVANQDTTQVFGTVFDHRTTSHKKLTYNYSYFLDVPLIVTYSRQSYPWVIGLEAGALWNLHLERKGSILDVDEAYYDLEKDTNNWFKDRVGMSVYLGANVAYHLSKSWQVTLSPAYRFPVELSSGNNPLPQKYSGAGLKAGLRYWW